jgi:hypothetical protein
VSKDEFLRLSEERFDAFAAKRVHRAPKEGVL